MIERTDNFVVVQRDIDRNKHMGNYRYNYHFNVFREMFFDGNGFSVDSLAMRELGLYIPSKDTKYVRPTFKGDSLSVKTRLRRYEGNDRIVIVQKMFRGDDIISREHSIYVLVGLEDGKSKEIP